MSDDLRRLLHDTAAVPAAPIDAAKVVRTARRQRVGLRIAAGMASVAVVAVAAVGLPQLSSDSGPEIVDTPPGGGSVHASISALDHPAGPEDELPRPVVDQLDIAPEAAATSRLVRRLPGHTFFLYADERPTQTASGPVVCVVVVQDLVPDATEACGSRRVPSPTHAPVLLRSDVGTVGIVPDGVPTAAEVDAGPRLPDVAVANNLFIDPAQPGTAALEGRSVDAFCAAAPGPHNQRPSLAESGDPFEMLEDMATTAPADIATDAYLVWDYLRFHPDAIVNDTVAFPDPIRSVANRVDDYIRSTCQGQPAPAETHAVEAPGPRAQVAGEVAGAVSRAVAEQPDLWQGSEGQAVERLRTILDELTTVPGVERVTPGRWDTTWRADDHTLRIAASAAIEPSDGQPAYCIIIVALSPDSSVAGVPATGNPDNGCAASKPITTTDDPLLGHLRTTE